MRRLNAVALLAEAFGDLFGDGDGAVLASGAAEGDGEVALPFLDVMRQQEQEHLGDAVEEFLRLGKVADVGGDLGMPAGELAELGDEVGIGQEAHVEDEVGFERDAVLVAEADRRDEQATSGAFALELGLQVGAQLVDVEVGGVESDVGDVADRIEQGAFRLDERCAPSLILARGCGRRVSE